MYELFKRYILHAKLRYKLSFLLLMIITATCLVSCGTSRPKNIGNICAVFREKSGWYDDAMDSSEKWGASVPVMMAIIRQESSFIDDAKPPRRKIWGFIPWKRLSSAKGYAQAIDGTWDNYENAEGGFFSSRYDFEDAIDFVGWYMKTEGLKRAKVPLNDAYNQYLVYHEGSYGYKRGSYKNKKQVKGAAKWVAKRASMYRGQLAKCEDEFSRSWF